MDTRCYFCNRGLTDVEGVRGNVCSPCSRERNGGERVPSKVEAFLAAHPGLESFAKAFQPRQQALSYRRQRW